MDVDYGRIGGKDGPVHQDFRNALSVLTTMAPFGDEHGKLDAAKASAPVNVRTRLEFVIPYCDPSVTLYDRIHCLRGDSVEAVWKIAARGMSQYRLCNI